MGATRRQGSRGPLPRLAPPVCQLSVRLHDDGSRDLVLAPVNRQADAHPP
jgi:hypothetical protein